MGSENWAAFPLTSLFQNPRNSFFIPNISTCTLEIDILSLLYESLQNYSKTHGPFLAKEIYTSAPRAGLKRALSAI